MSAAAGLLLGLGLFLVWRSCWVVAPAAARTPRTSRLEDELLQAGIQRVTPRAVVGASAAAGLLAALLVLAGTGAVPVAACFGLFGAAVPLFLVRWQARKQRSNRAELWPDAVDHLRSAIRAGLSLPEALIQLGENGPEELRQPFREFAADYRSGGHFDSSLTRLKANLADPVADRIVEALRLTREVGGSDLGRLLGTLNEFLRDNARTRSELLARQSWTVNAARLAVAAPWIVLMLLASRPEAITAYNSAAGAMILAAGLVISVICYRLMLRIGALPEEERVLR